mmetsp:Transcript_13205/g.31012  ORF Transcript_13205/g.31012 Transcript_13205/m.31012 type:complete len:253 (+) Transcript_13205:3-761(+)
MIRQSLGLVVALQLATFVLALEEVKFAEMDSKAENQVVLIYKSGEEASDSALAAVTAAHETLKGSGVAGLENLAFKKSDAADASNANEMLKKGIATYPMLFVSVKGQGLDRYMREIDADKVANYIRTKLEPSSDDDVFPFNRELITKDYPTMVHFTEPWCTRCKTFKHVFQHVASNTVGSVMCMEVECSSSKDARKFCDQHKIDGFPTVMLTGGELKKPVEFTKDRSIPALFEWLKETVPDAMLALDEEVIA